VYSATWPPKLKSLNGLKPEKYELNFNFFSALLNSADLRNIRHFFKPHPAASRVLPKQSTLK
jgi:hypothetical protein